jgi:tetratricopeptide (TPR) repeat protein
MSIAWLSLLLLVGGLGVAHAGDLADPSDVSDVSDLYQDSYDLETAGNYSSALQRVVALEAKGERGYVIQLRKAWLSYLTGRHDDAIVGYRAAISAEPDSLEARQGLILPLIAAKRWEGAEAACRDLLSRSPDDYYGLSRLAWVLFSAGRYPEAAKAYGEVLRRYPSDVDMRAGLGWSLLKQDQQAEARAAFAAVLAVAPNHASALEGVDAAQ